MEWILIRVGKVGQVRLQKVRIQRGAVQLEALVYASHPFLIEEVKQVGHKLQVLSFTQFQGIVAVEAYRIVPVRAPERAASPLRNFPRILIGRMSQELADGRAGLNRS